MKYKPGDEVFIKAEITDVSGYECSERPYFVAPDIHSVNWVSEDKIIPMDKTYEQGLSDAWELARRLYALRPDERDEMFKYSTVKAIIEDCTIEEVMDKIEAYEKEKEIKVGDVVKKGKNGSIGVVTSMGVNGVYIMWDDGSCGLWGNKDLIKKDKHIDIESLLRQIGE